MNYVAVVSRNFPRVVRVDLATVGGSVMVVTLICSPPWSLSLVGEVLGARFHPGDSLAPQPG